MAQRAIHPLIHCCVDECPSSTRCCPTRTDGSVWLETGRPEGYWLCSRHWRRVPKYLKRRRTRLIQRWRRTHRKLGSYWQMRPGSPERLAMLKLEDMIRRTWLRCVGIAGGTAIPVRVMYGAAVCVEECMEPQSPVELPVEPQSVYGTAIPVGEQVELQSPSGPCMEPQSRSPRVEPQSVYGAAVPVEEPGGTAICVEPCMELQSPPRVEPQSPSTQQVEPQSRSAGGTAIPSERLDPGLRTELERLGLL